jgi:hypothetical protein
MLGDSAATWTPQTQLSPFGVEGAYQNAIAAQDPILNQTIVGARVPGEDYINAGLRVAQSYILADSQRRLLNAQLTRAQSGLPPLDSSQYGMGVSLGLSGDTQKWIMYGAGALLIAFLVLRRRGR